jgi:hypothetical protein
MLQVLAEREHTLEWVARVRAPWAELVSSPPTGALSMELTELISGKEISELSDVAREVVNRIAAEPDPIPKEDLSAIFSETIRRDLETSHPRDIGEALVALLSGEPRSVPPQIVPRDDRNWRGG